MSLKRAGLVPAHMCRMASLLFLASTVACRPKSAIFASHRPSLPVDGTNTLTRCQTNTALIAWLRDHQLPCCFRLPTISRRHSCQRRWVTLTAHEDIIQLQIAVDDGGVQAVQVRQALRDLGRPAQTLRVCVQRLQMETSPEVAVLITLATTLCCQTQGLTRRNTA